ncbi:MAG: anti-sigma factor [Thermodesulfobacteriota bacterium]
MWSCPRYRRRLSPYLDGELAHEERARVARHLATCPACRAVLGEMHGLATTLRAAGNPSPPAGLTARILAAARQPERLDQDQPLPQLDSEVPCCPAWALTGTAVVALVLILVVLGRDMGRQLHSGDGRPAVARATSLEGFEWFHTAPPGSLGAAYLVLASSSPTPELK